jgi:hypothetical protein
MAFSEACNVFGEIHKASGRARCATGYTLDEILGEIVGQPNKGYNASDISGVTSIKELDV